MTRTVMLSNPICTECVFYEGAAYLELHQVDVHVPVVPVLSHGVCELRDSVAGGSQPRLDLRQVEDDLPVGSGVERWRFIRPETTQN